MAAPWQPPAADDPRAIGLKSSGLSDMSSDILYPASRMVNEDFKAGSTLEFRWRSDSSRHWLPLQTIKQHLDAMAAVKMNALHWHIVDEQSFPFASPSLPSLSDTGAWTPDHVYTFADIREIVVYAGERGVRVIPEIDGPGHVLRGWESLGVLTECFDGSGKRTGTGPLNPTLNATFTVLHKLWSGHDGKIT